MIKLFSIIIIIFFISCGGNVKEAMNEIDHSNIISENQKSILFNRLKMFPDETEVAVALIRNGNVTFFGVKREAGALKHVENQSSVFEIGSISKVFTSTLLADLSIKGELNLTDNINDLYDFPFMNNVEIKYQDLSNHTTGLPRLPSSMMFSALFNLSNPYKDYSGDDLETYLKEEIKLDFTTGERSAYSNLGAGLLAYSLEKKTGKTYEQMLQDVIFKPLGMTMSTTNRERVNANLVLGRDAEGDETSNWDFQALAGAGAILSNAEDMSKFAIAQFDSANHAMTLTRKPTYEESPTRHIGLGWFILDQDAGNSWAWHNGGTGGYRSSMVVDVTNQNAIVVLSNISSSHGISNFIDKVCFDLMNTLYEFDERLAEVKFLEGTWKVKGKKRYESWDIVAGGSMKGIGFKAEMGSNDIFEYLTLRIIDNEMVYEARVPDQNDGRTIQFKRNPNFTDALSFENPNHDFPNKIQYKIIDEITINISVLGNDDQGLNYDLIKQETE